MSDIISEIRPMWLNGLNAVNGRLQNSLINWIDNIKGYVVYDQINTDDFSLYITNYAELLRSFGYDINRFGSASFESMNEINYIPAFPRSHAWKCIKSYYAAYYAAHAILRMLGESCTNIERINTQRVESIADLFGMKNGVTINKGYYSCVVDSANSKLICSRISTGGNKGSHEQLWEVFLGKLNFLITEISKKGSSVQPVILKLLDLRDNLTYMGCNGGNWLSKIRNDVSYKQLYGLWHPYNDYEDYYQDFEAILAGWKTDTNGLKIGIYQGKAMLRFISTCSFIVALFKDLAIDMANRCPSGHSFLTAPSLSFYNRATAI